GVGKGPGRRSTSAAELVVDWQRFLDDEPVKARPIGRPRKLLKWAKRRKALAALFTLLPFSLLLLVIGAVVTRLWWRAEAARGEAEVARELLRDEQALTKAALLRQAPLPPQLRPDPVPPH